MVGACRRGMRMNFTPESPKKRGPLEDIDVSVRLTLKWILNTWDVRVWSWFSWFRIRISGGLL